MGTPAVSPPVSVFLREAPPGNHPFPARVLCGWCRDSGGNARRWSLLCALLALRLQCWFTVTRTGQGELRRGRATAPGCWIELLLKPVYSCTFRLPRPNKLPFCLKWFPGPVLRTAPPSHWPGSVRAEQPVTAGPGAASPEGICTQAAQQERLSQRHPGRCTLPRG